MFDREQVLAVLRASHYDGCATESLDDIADAICAASPTQEPAASGTAMCVCGHEQSAHYFGDEPHTACQAQSVVPRAGRCRCREYLPVRAARPTDESRAPEGGDSAKRTERIGTRGDWCFDCGREYGSEHGFPDLVVPHAVWNEHISPFKHEGGLLCPSCMVKRAHDAGLENVPAEFRSGPFAALARPADTEASA